MREKEQNMTEPWGALLVKSSVLGKFVWVAKNSEEAKLIPPDGHPIYLLSEILAMEKLTEKEKQLCQEVRDVFEGGTIGERGLPVKFSGMRFHHAEEI